MTSDISLCLAYIDPGTGSLLLQFLYAGLVGGLIFFRNQLVGLLSWVKHKALTRKN